MSDLWNYNDGEDSDLSDSQGMKSTVDNNVVGSCVGREEGDICVLQSRCSITIFI
jgi:hypothetical protein